jgi:hypothetical protein
MRSTEERRWTDASERGMGLYTGKSRVKWKRNMLIYPLLWMHAMDEDPRSQEHNEASEFRTFQQALRKKLMITAQTKSHARKLA